VGQKYETVALPEDLQRQGPSALIFNVRAPVHLAYKIDEHFVLKETLRGGGGG